MAKLERPQIEMLVDSARDNNDSQILIREQTLLLRSNERKRYYCRMSCVEPRPGNNGRRVKMAACCLKSKGIIIILCWNTLLTLLTIPWLLPDTYSLIIATLRHTSLQEASLIAVPSFYIFEAILYLFYPLAGYLADIKYGRYKTITRSLWLVFWSGVFLVIGGILLACYLVLHSHDIVKMSALTVSLLAVGFGLPSVIGAVLLLTCYVSFKANIIQFGMDQLRDLPTEHSVLFIHWFVFSTFVGITLIRFLRIPFILHPASFTLLKLDFTMKIVAGGFFGIHVVALVILLVTLYLSKRQCQSEPWFTTESAMLDSRRTINPYKLVYKVIKFAAQHKSPIRRSAFTYCEDELPSRMDLAKEKYGGPFTTEQVEDVKTFLRILQVLLTLGPFFGTHLFGGCTDSSKEKSSTSTPPLLVSILSFGGLTDFLSVVFILFYICLLRRFICRCIPGISMLKRMGLGMGLLLLISIFHFLVDTIGRNIYNVHFPISLYVCYLLTYRTLSAIGYTLFFIAAYEFICAQSPHAMKGLLIGTFFTVKGVSQLMGTTVVVLLSKYWWKLETPATLNCGLVYSLINIIIAIIGLVAYSWVARRYRHRQRDEPDNIYRYAEEYYSTHR
jgi:peptide/histidine transporter 3/4